MGHRSLFNFNVEILLYHWRNSEMTITYSRSSFCNTFYKWESSRGPHTARGPYVVQAWLNLFEMEYLYIATMDGSRRHDEAGWLLLVGSRRLWFQFFFLGTTLNCNQWQGRGLGASRLWEYGMINYLYSDLRHVDVPWVSNPIYRLAISKD